MNLKTGKLDIIIGPMFSGKTTELLRRGTIEAMIKNNKVLFVNHSIDTRSNTAISTHNPFYKNNEFKNTDKMYFIKIHNISDLLKTEFSSFNVICIDEAQFFSNLTTTVVELTDKCKKHIILSGLSGDYNRTLIGDIYKLIPLCDSIKKLSSYCLNCSSIQNKKLAHFNHKINEIKNDKILDDDKILNNDKNSSNIQVGAENVYEVLCRTCYLKKNK